MDTKTKIPFTKMQGAGNDFIVIDNRVSLISKKHIISLAPALCDRRFGIGADGVMLLEQSNDPDLDYTMFYRNADGSDAGMCGNGARCLAFYASNLGLGEELMFDVHDHVYEARVQPEEQTVAISFPMDVSVEDVDLNNGENVLQVQAGTEHIVKNVQEKQLEDEELLFEEGKRLRYHDRFNPPGTNVNFIYGTSANSLKLQTYERGVEGLTLACGTGAIASALAWHHLSIQTGGEKEQQTTVKTKGGSLMVHYRFDNQKKSYNKILLTGGAQIVFEGVYTV